MLELNKELRCCLVLNYKTNDVLIVVAGRFQALRLSKGANDLVPGQLHQAEILSDRKSLEAFFSSKQLLSPKKQLMILTNVSCDFHLIAQEGTVGEQLVVFHQLFITADLQQKFDIRLVNQLDLTEKFQKVLGNC